MPDLFPFRIGEASPANTFFAIWMAKDAGLYEAYGLKPEIVKVVGGKDSGPDLASGKIHLMHIGMSSVVRANAAGGDIVTVGSLSNIIRNTMFVAPGIKTPSDLKGKKIGISSIGSETDPTTTLALRRLGIRREDVTIVEIGTVRLDAVRTGAVAASLMGEPTRSQALALGLTAMVDLYADHTPWLYSGLVVHRPFLATHRAQVKAFLKTTVEGNYLAVTDEARAKRVLARELGLTDQKFIDVSYANFKAETPMNAEMTLEGAKNIIDIVAVPPASRDPSAYMDESLHREIEAEGFYRQMRAKYLQS